MPQPGKKVKELPKGQRQTCGKPCSPWSSMSETGSGIRGLKPDDLPALVRLQRGVMSRPWSLRQFTDSIEAGHLCLVMEYQNR